jgi:enoyl-CoA hydratase
MSEAAEAVVKIVSEGAVSELVINRPKALNALNAEVLSALCAAVETLHTNPALRAIIITGAGEKAFVAGADIASMAALGPTAIAEYVDLGQRTMRLLETARVPVIAAVNGFALGGGLELALACDLIVASAAAKVGQPEVNLGIIPGFGGTQRLLQRCSIGTARRLVLTGEIISAAEAQQLGIVDKVVEPSELMTAARGWAELIASKAPLAVSESKRVIRAAQEQALVAGLGREVESFLTLFASADRAEGMAAFLEKRPAQFKNR